MAVRIQLRRGTAAAWTSADPVLLPGELGLETDTQLYKIGDGATAWSALGYARLRDIDSIDLADMTGQSSLPSAASAGHANFYAKTIVGRMKLGVTGPDGIHETVRSEGALVPPMWILPSTSTALGVLGCTAGTNGTISHPTVVEAYGWAANFASAASIGATAGTGHATTALMRGASSGRAGFWFDARLGFADASYEFAGASTGSRIFVGLTSVALSAVAAADAIAGESCGFLRRSVNGGAQDTNWKFATRDGTTAGYVDTGMPFAAGKVYDFQIGCASNGSAIHWRIRNVTDGTLAEGSTSTYLPLGPTLMRGGFNLQTVNAQARNIRMMRVYAEAAT